jgi:hypothetical protein
MEEAAAETTVVRGKGRAMSTHERFVGLYEYDTQTTRIERLSDKYEHPRRSHGPSAAHMAPNP